LIRAVEQAVESRRKQLDECKLLARNPLAGEIDLRLTFDVSGDATCVCLESVDTYSDPIVAACVEEELAGLHVDFHRAAGVIVTLHLVASERHTD
jgi:hypothetical protein